MSVWRMQIDMAFATEAEMNSMVNLIQEMRDKLQKKVDPQFPIPCEVTTHECHHDVGGACGGYVRTEFDGVTGPGAPADTIVPDTIKTVIKAPLEAEKATLIAEKAALQTEIDDLKKPKPTGATGL